LGGGRETSLAQKNLAKDPTGSKNNVNGNKLCPPIWPRNKTPPSTENSSFEKQKSMTVKRKNDFLISQKISITNPFFQNHCITAHFYPAQHPTYSPDLVLCFQN
jgi:hypothetical protein